MGFGGKKVGHALVGFGSSGLGQALTAVTVALLVRLFSGPGPALLPDSEADDEYIEENQNEGVEGGEADSVGKLMPVTIRWRNITCSLTSKSKPVTDSLARLRRITFLSFSFFFDYYFGFPEN